MLLQDAQIIVLVPLFDYLAILDAVNGDAFDLDLPAGGRAELFRRALVCASARVAAYHLVPFDYQILDAEAGVGEGLQEAGDELLCFLDTAKVLLRHVPDDIRG
jgi:hypothetical protein